MTVVPEAEMKKPFEGKNAVLIDEDAGWAKKVEAALKEMGFQVSVHNEGKAGLRAIIKERPQIVVLEFLTPGLDGFSICEAVRREKDAGLAATPMLMMTSVYLTKADLEQGLEWERARHYLKADAFLMKPFRSEDLKENVAALIERRGPRTGKDKVLVVDDTASIVELAKVRLEKDFDVATAIDGQDAIEKMMIDKPQLVLMDIQMPRMDGITALQIIKEAYPDVAVVMMTAYGSEEIAIEAMKKGADDYLTKPLKTRELPITVRENIDKRRFLTINATLTEQLKELTTVLIGRYKDIERTVALRTEQLVQSEKMAAVGTLAAGVAHEINTPLTNISLYAQMLRDNCKEDPEAVKYLEVVIKNVESAAKIVTELLEFSHQSRMERVNCDVNHVVDGAVELIHHQLDLDKVKVEKEFGKDLPMVPLDQGRIQQVVLNLVINAQHAIKGAKGGKIRLGTAMAIGKVKGKDEGKGDMKVEGVQITVEDNGTGISVADRDKVFEPFYTTKGAGKGTGLGLSICKGIVEAHGGTIDFESKVGEGTRFEVFLPLKPPNGPK